MIHLTFSSAAWDETTGRLIGRTIGRETHVLDADEVTVPKSAKWLLETEWRRGWGWFWWKPMLIQALMHRAYANEWVLYTDADVYPVQSWPFELLDANALIFSAGAHLNQHWTRRECFDAMGIEPFGGPAGNASIVAFRNTIESQTFLSEWLAYSLRRECNGSTSGSKRAIDLDGFREHRCEQSVLTLLAFKYGYKLHRDPSQHGNGITWPGDDYPQLFEHVANMTPAGADTSRSKWRGVHR